MTDLDDRLRELLERKAAEVPPHLDVPRQLRSRSRRRIALNVALAAIVVLGLGGVAVGTLRALERAGETTPGGSASTAEPSPSVTYSPTPALAPCATGELRAGAQLEGAMGSRVGVIVVTDSSSAECTLVGRPGLVLLHPDGGAEPDVAYEPVEPAWRVDDRPRPPGWPVVTLAPGEAASIRVRWANWCPDGRPDPRWAIDMPDGRVTISGTDAIGAPPCLDPSSGPMVEVGPFEPAVT